MNTSGTHLRALICEDEGITVMQLRRALQRAGYEVVGEAADGEDAIRLAEDLQPDVIIMDLNMPRVSGVEATRRITERRPVPIVVLTAYSDELSVDAAMQAGACAYLVKPVSADQLMPAVRAALARFDAMEAVRKENEDLKDALETRKLVERAKGILMTRKNLAEAEAFRLLQKMSRDKCQTMKRTAVEIIEADRLFS
ncbi:MAG: ANTAR domain-containing response regulator [Chthonomonadales bacterium]